MSARSDLKRLAEQRKYWRGELRLEIRWLRQTSAILAKLEVEMTDLLKQSGTDRTPKDHPGVKRLLDALRQQEGVPDWLMDQAARGYYHKPFSALIIPQIQLIQDLRGCGYDDLVKRAIHDEFEETQEEILSVLDKRDKTKSSKK